MATEGNMFKLTENNCAYWKLMMEDYLYSHALYEAIINKDNPEGKSAKEWEILNRKTVAIIRKYIDESLFGNLFTYTNAFELWEKIESIIKKQQPRNKVLLVRKLVKLKYKEGESMLEHLNNFKGLVNQLAYNDLKIDDEFQAFLLLGSLPESWDSLVVTLTSLAPEGTKINIDTVSDILLKEEFIRNRHSHPLVSERHCKSKKN